MTETSVRTRQTVYWIGLALILMTPAGAQAHVKWFCGPIDTSIPPAPLRQVLTQLYFTGLAAFATLVGIGAFIDALVERFLPRSVARLDRAECLVDWIIRIGLSAYALGLWQHLAVVLWADDATGSVLTPEMLNHHAVVGWLQLAIAGLVLVPRLSLAAAAGLLTLYTIGLARFGLFYMIDYLFFLGLTAYVALAQPMMRGFRLAAWRTSILTASLSLSLMWTAVEKFLFPQWTIAVLLHHPSITAGYSFPTVTTIAGFVEFSLSFYLLAGRAVLVRVAAVLLAGVFVIAMPEFGMVDVVGHIPVIIILVATLLHGETDLQRTFRGSAAGAARSGVRVAASYVVTLFVLMFLYYGLHAGSVWLQGKSVRVSQPAPAAALSDQPPAEALERSGTSPP